MLVAAGAAGLLLAPAGAQASSFSQLYQDYGSSGSIQACRYSAGDLRSTLGSIPPDVQAYDPGFGDAVNNALGSGCGSSGGAAPSPTAAAAPVPSGPTPQQLVRADRKRARHTTKDGSPKPVVPRKAVLPTAAPAFDSAPQTPPAVIALAAALGLLVLTGGGLALGRYFGWSPAGAHPGGRRGPGRRAADALAGLRDRIRR